MEGLPRIWEVAHVWDLNFPINFALLHVFVWNMKGFASFRQCDGGRRGDHRTGEACNANLGQRNKPCSGFFFIQVALNCKLSIIAEQYVILFFFFFLPHLQTCMSGIKWPVSCIWLVRSQGWQVPWVVNEFWKCFDSSIALGEGGLNTQLMSRLKLLWSSWKGEDGCLRIT